MVFFRINESLLQELDGVRKKVVDHRLESHLKKKSLEELRLLYEQVTLTLGRKFYFIKIRTRFELQFHFLLKGLSRVGCRPCYWIGKNCVDLYLPRYNLIIEIDGWIHDGFVKMLKDEHRDELFKQLKLMVVHVANRNVRKFSNELLIGLKTGQLKKVDSRALNRRMRSIYIETIISNKELIRTQMWN